MSRARRFSLAHGLSQLLRFILPAVVIVFAAERASAQGSGITEGSRIKVSAGQKRVAGIVRSTSGDSTSIYVDGEGGVLKFANQDIRELKVSRGRTHSAGAKKGAMWGGGIGALLAIAVLATPEDNNDYEYPGYSNNRIAASTFTGSLIWGVGLGAIIKAEEWEKVPVRASVAKTSGGMGLSLAFSPSFLH